ncbi:MAG TPA: FtsX-like permease family protein [Roseateles sp.]
MPSLTPFKFAWRQLRADPVQGALVVIGLALGVALCLIAAAYVRGLIWADAGVPALDRMVTFEWRTRGPGGSHSDWNGEVPAARLQAGLIEAGAPLEASIKQMGTQLMVRAEDGAGQAPRRAKLVTSLVDPAVVGLFGLRALQGDLAAALASPEGIALTVSGADKLFGRHDVLGRRLDASMPAWNPGATPPAPQRLVVMAVLPDPGFNGALGGYQALTGFGSAAARQLLEQRGAWTFSSGNVFARLAPGATAAQLTQLAQRLLEQQPVPAGLPPDFLKGGGAWAYLRAMPLNERVLHGADSGPRRLKLFSVVATAGAVLLLAAINFVNLWSVRTLARQREIGLRKSLGADAAALLRQFFVEALVVVGLASALGLLLAWWAVPPFQVLMQHSLDANPLAAPALVGVAGGAVLIAALSALPLGGIALRVSAQASLAGRQHSEGVAARWLRRVLTLLQFAAAAALSAMAIVVLWQHHHATHLPRGIAVDNRLAFDLPFGSPPAQGPALLRRIQSWPEVIQASASGDVPGRAFNESVADYLAPGSGARVTLHGLDEISPGYFPLYGVKLLAGRLSAEHAAEQDANGVVLDRSAVALLGIASPAAAIGQQLGVTESDLGTQPLTIVAVAEDMRLEDVHRAAAPHAFFPRKEVGYGAIGIHSRDPEATRQHLVALLREAFPEEPPQALSLRDQLGRQVADDERIGRLVAIVGLLALGLAAVGLYALAAYTLRHREREIVLRKLHGAGGVAVARLLATEFAAVLAAACAVALPLAAWGAERYLSDFTERAPMGPFSLWALLAAAALLAGATTLAVARHLRAAMALRPLQALTS